MRYNSEFKSVWLAPADRCCVSHVAESQQRRKRTRRRGRCRIIRRMPGTAPCTGLPSSNCASCAHQFCDRVQCCAGRSSVADRADWTVVSIPRTSLQGSSGAIRRHENYQKPLQMRISRDSSALSTNSAHAEHCAAILDQPRESRSKCQEHFSFHDEHVQSVHGRNAGLLRASRFVNDRPESSCGHRRSCQAWLSSNPATRPSWNLHACTSCSD